jgi:geranylgeranyl pyrophosphate synthase
MLAYRNEALAVLHTFPETDARHALEGLVHLTVNRTK